MTLENMLRKKLAEAPVAGSAGAVLPYDGWNVILRPDAQDTLSCSLWDVIMERPAWGRDGDPRAWAEQICRKATGLLEPLKLVEIDAGKRIALLRSAEPTPRDPGLEYHEVELHGTNRATVRRFRGFQEAGRKREQIPFTVTYEALAQLVRGITAEA